MTNLQLEETLKIAKLKIVNLYIYLFIKAR